ncbi:MAG: hypothetical protein M1833_005763 [Piccolia ochrophora]|nr:MAG: hypothetical protein M1833_005763 [Piccolia ochrophora]
MPSRISLLSPAPSALTSLCLRCSLRPFSTSTTHLQQPQSNSSPGTTGPNITRTSSDPPQRDARFRLAERNLEIIRQQNVRKRAAAVATAETARLTQDLERYVGRRWKPGDVYAPHDLSSVEAKKWRKRGGPGVDALDVLAIDPRDEYKNFAMMAEYTSPSGRIRHSFDTGLRARNQRRMAKAVRRAVGLGLVPSVYKHPELLMMDREKRERVI